MPCTCIRMPCTCIRMPSTCIRMPCTCMRMPSTPPQPPLPLTTPTLTPATGAALIAPNLPLHHSTIFTTHPAPPRHTGATRPLAPTEDDKNKKAAEAVVAGVAPTPAAPSPAPPQPLPSVPRPQVLTRMDSGTRHAEAGSSRAGGDKENALYLQRYILVVKPLFIYTSSILVVKLQKRCSSNQVSSRPRHRNFLQDPGAG
jgi:hypothetical protein